jgi:hypothetical protein
MLERVRDPWDRHPDLRGARDASLVHRTEAFRVRLA